MQFYTWNSIRTYIHVVLCTWIICQVLSGVTADECTGMDQCSCQYSDGRQVALHSLGNNDGTPRFQDVKGDDGSKYSYNPCYPFEEGGNCAQAAACETNSVGVIDTIGTQQTAEFSSDDGLSVGYSAGTGILTNTYVSLVCDHSACTPKFSAAGSSGPNAYQFTLKTVCACPGACDESGPVGPCTSGGGGGIGGGTIFLIIFIVVVVVYIVGGIIFQKFVRKASGKEIIPNVGFWTSLPGYLKAGTLFVIKPLRSRKSTYDSI